MINLLILVDDPNIVLEAGYTQVRVYSDVSAGGAFTSLLGSVSVIQDQESVQFLDILGTISTWYKTAYYGAGVGEGDKSDAFQADAGQAYASVLELRRTSDKQYAEDDLTIQMALDAAKIVIDGYCNRPMGFVANSTPVSRLYSSWGGSHLYIDECVSVTGVEVKDDPTDTVFTAWITGDWILCSGDPEEPEFNDAPFDMLITSGVGQSRYFWGSRLYSWREDDRDNLSDLPRLPNVRVTGRWGYAAACPPSVKMATILLASRWLKRGQSAWADTLSTDNGGTLNYRKALDPDLQMMLTLARLVKPATGRR